MAEEWITIEELRAAGWKERRIQREAAAGRVKSRATKQRSANGRPIREFLLSSLPSDLLFKIEGHRGAVARGEQGPAQSATGKLVAFGREPASAEAPRIVLPSPEEQAEAQHRLQTIGPLVDYLRQRDPAERQAWCHQNSLGVKSARELAQLIAAEERCAPSTIWRWLKNFREGGFAALADPARRDKGLSRWFEQHPQARVFAAYLYLIERMSVTAVCEQIEYDAQRLGIETTELPSRETVRIFLSQNISNAMKTYAREGERQYRERMAPYLKRGYVDTWANQIWVGDHGIHDVEVMNDIFEEIPLGTRGRLRISAFVDYRSRKAFGTWAWEGSSRSIAATLVRGILEVGPPEHIYVDNGKDYRKVARGATPASALSDDEKAPAQWWLAEYGAIEKTGILARLGITVTHCIPRHPQSKHVERFFRTMHERFDKMFATYTSGSPATRPEQTEEAMSRHRWLMKHGRVDESEHPAASRFIQECLAWIEEYNNARHSGEGMDGRTPNEVFAAERNPKQKASPTPPQLALLLLDYQERRVRECAVQIAKRRYTPLPEDRGAWAAMHEANESNVLVAYNSGDPEFAVALDKDGRFLAWLEAEPMLRFAPWDEQTQKQIGQSMEIRRGLEKATRKSLEVIAAEARAAGARTGREALQDRLKLASGSGAIITQPARLRPDRRPTRPLTPAEVARTLVTQRAPRLRPDNTAVAPLSASEIAKEFLEKLG